MTTEVQVGVQIDRSAKDLRQLQNFLKSQGISNLPESSAVAKRVRASVDELVDQADPKWPITYKTIMAENVVMNVLIARSAATTIIACKRPVVSSTAIGEVRNKAYALATKTFFTASRAVMDGLKQLGYKQEGVENTPNLDDLVAGMSVTGENANEEYDN